MKKLILSLFCGALGLSYAQETDANILGSVEIGGARYYVLQDPGTGKYFKSEITSVDVLKYGDIVKLEQQVDLNGFQQIKDASFNNLFKAKEQTSSQPNNGVNYVDPQVLYRLPKVKNGVLFFENRKHFDELYNYIDAYLDSKKDIPGKKDALALIESKISGYISFRTYFDQKYNSETNEFSDAEVEMIEKEDFLNDEILKFFINNRRQVVIGSEYYFGFDFYTAMSVSTREFDKYQSIFDNLHNDPLFSPYNVNYPIYHDSKVSVLSTTKELKKQKSGWIWLNGSAYYHRLTYEINHIPVLCDPNTKALTVNVEYGYFDITEPSSPDNFEEWYDLSGKNAVLKINWGDGSAVQTISNYTGQAINHTFPGPNTYPIFVKVTFIDAFNNVSVLSEGNVSQGENPISIEVTDVACGSSDKEKSLSTISGDWKLYSEIWVTDNWLGNRVGALTHSWKKKSNGNWTRKISNITAKIDAQMRNSDCEVVQNLSETDVENQERVDAVKFKLFKRYRAVANADIKSYHKLVKGGTTIIVNMEITACP